MNQINQLGSKLVGLNNEGSSNQGQAVSLSSNGSLAVGGPFDNSNSLGATWRFQLTGGTYTQAGNKMVGSGAVGTFNINQGSSVSLSSDGLTMAVGGPGDNGNIGATWIFKLTGGSFTQVGSKLVGSGAIGYSNQGSSVSLSANGSVGKDSASSI